MKRQRFLPAVLFLMIVAAYPAAQAQRLRLEGVVVDGQNQPIERVTVTISGSPSRRATSDEQGRFSFENLQPARYVIEASRPGFVTPRPVVLTLQPPQDLKGVQLKMLATAAISGVVLDRNGAPLPFADVVVARPAFDRGRKFLPLCLPPEAIRARADSAGAFRLYGLAPGEYFFALVSSSCDGLPEFYPGGIYDAGLATPITVSSGADLRLDFRSHPGPTHAIRFKVPKPPKYPYPYSGTELQAILTRKSNGVETTVLVGMGLLGNGLKFISPDEYVMNELPPGSYSLTVGVDILWAHVAQRDFNVVDRDEDLGTLVAREMVALSGRVRFADEASGTSNKDYPGLRLRLRYADVPPGRTSTPISRSGPFADLRADGTFQIPRTPGRFYDVAVERLPAGVYVESAKYDGRDVLDTGFLLDSTPPAELEIVLSRAGAAINGTVVNSRGEALATAPVVLVPPVNRRRNPETFKFILTDQHGQFSFSALPPGEYSLLAWEDDLEAGSWANEEFLKGLESQATKLSLSKGSVSTPRLLGIAR